MTLGQKNLHHRRDKTFLTAAFSGCVEVGCSHPLDYIKSSLQRNRHMQWRSCYSGVTTRLCSVIPMRGVLWTAQHEGARMTQFSMVEKCGLLGCGAGVCQTLFDLPCENVKLQLMLGTKDRLSYSPRRLVLGGVPNTLRNMVLCTCILGGAFSPLGGGGLPALFAGSALGCLLSQPFDYAKTVLQSRGTLCYTDFTSRQCMTGWLPRATITPLNILVSYSVFRCFE